MNKKLIKTLALGAFAIGGGFSTLASTSCGSSAPSPTPDPEPTPYPDPKGDFILSYVGDPFIGTFTSASQTLTSNAPINVSGISSNNNSSIEWKFKWTTNDGSGVYPDTEPSCSIQEDKKLKITWCSTGGLPHNCTFVIIAYATYNDTATNELKQSNQLAFYFDVATSTPTPTPIHKPTGDFILSYTGDPYVGTVMPDTTAESELIQVLRSSIINDDSDLTWYLNFDCDVIDKKQYSCEIKPDSGGYKLCLGPKSGTSTSGPSRTYVVIVYATKSTESNDKQYSNQLAFFFDWSNG